MINSVEKLVTVLIWAFGESISVDVVIEDAVPSVGTLEITAQHVFIKLRLP